MDIQEASPTTNTKAPENKAKPAKKSNVIRLPKNSSVEEDMDYLKTFAHKVNQKSEVVDSNQGPQTNAKNPPKQEAPESEKPTEAAPEQPSNEKESSEKLDTSIDTKESAAEAEEDNDAEVDLPEGEPIKQGGGSVLNTIKYMIHLGPQNAKRFKATLDEITPGYNDAFAKSINFGKTRKGRVEFGIGSWAIVYKGQTPVRMVPFMWQQDIETRSTWAVFNANDFYGRKPSNIPWRRVWTQVVIMPMDKSRYSADHYGNGYLIKVDEASLTQMSMHIRDTDKALAARIEDMRFVSQDLSLYRDLNKYLKAKFNWTMIIIAVVLLIIISVALYLYFNPGVLNQLTHMLGI